MGLLNIDAFNGGYQMSHVEFKKWQCPLSLFLQYVDIYVAIYVACQTRNCPCHVTSIFSHVDRLLVAC